MTELNEIAPHQHQLTVASRFDELDKCWNFVVRVLKDSGVSLGDDEMAVRLAFVEAVTNAMRHAHKLDGRPLLLVVSTQGEDMTLEIHDTGPGFDITTHRGGDQWDESGRGVNLMRQLMDEVSFERHPDHNVLRLRKTIPTPNTEGTHHGNGNH